MDSNIWCGTVGDSKTSLYAGVKLDDQQRAVLFHMMDARNKTVFFEEFDTPTKDGAGKAIKKIRTASFWREPPASDLYLI